MFEIIKDAHLIKFVNQKNLVTLTFTLLLSVQSSSFAETFTSYTALQQALKSAFNVEVSIDGDITNANSTIKLGQNGYSKNITILGNLDSDGNRYAISPASWFHQNIFDVQDSTTLTLKDLIIKDTNVTSWSGAIYNDGTLKLSNVNFNNNKANFGNGGVWGGAIGNDADGQVFLSGNMQFLNNKSTANSGGAIHNRGYFIANSTGGTIEFVGNSANINGGAIFNEIENGSDGYLALEGDGNYIFDGNTASNGGAIYNAGQMTISGTFDFKNNVATSKGGAIFNKGNLYLAGSRDVKSKITSIIFDGNSVQGSGNKHGGALYVEGSYDTPAFLDIKSVDFLNNATTSHGGAIYLDKNVDFNIEDSYFADNTTNTDSSNIQGWGGAVGLGSGSVNGYINNSVFSRNYAADSGGVIASHTSLAIVNSKFYGNHAKLSAGAIAWDPNVSQGQSLKIIANGDDTIFANNHVDGFGSVSASQEGIYIGNQIPHEVDTLDSEVYFNAGNSGSIIFNDIVNAYGDSYDDVHTGGRDPLKANHNIQLNQAGVEYSRYDANVSPAGIQVAPTNGEIVFNNIVKGANLVLHNGTLSFRQKNLLDGYVENLDKYFTHGAKLTLKGGTLNLINEHIESDDQFKPDNLNVLGEANLRLDLNLTKNSDGSLSGVIDKINSDIIGSGKLIIDKLGFSDDSNVNSGEDFDRLNSVLLQFANSNSADTELLGALKTIITNNGGYSLELAESEAGKGNNCLKIDQIVNAGGLPVAVSLGQDKNFASEKTYIYSATEDEIIGGTNSWQKGYKVWGGTQAISKQTSNILKGDELQINGNNYNVIGANNVVGIVLGVENGKAQELTISDVKRADGTGGWYGFNSAIINNGGKVTLNNSIFSNNNAESATYADIDANQTVYKKDANGGAVLNKDGELHIVNTSFKNNSAKNQGGAIYNKAKVYILANDFNNIEFTGNTAQNGGNDIYNIGNLNLSTSEDSTIIFNSGISGDGTGVINIGYSENGNDYYNQGSVIFNAIVANQNINLNNGTLQVGTCDKVFENVNLNLNGGTLDARNGKIDIIDVNNMTIGSGMQSTLKLDVDLTSSSDKINLTGDLTQGSEKLKLGPLSILNKLDKDTYTTEYINDSAITAEIDAANRVVTVDDTTYQIDVTNNILTISKLGSSGGFAYEVINSDLLARTYNVVKNEIITSWIDGKRNLAGNKFYIYGANNGYKINGTNLEGIIVSNAPSGNSQELDIVDVSSYQNFDTVAINNGGNIITSGSTFENNNSTTNGGVFQNNLGKLEVGANSVLQNNTTQGNGGAIYNKDSLVLDATLGSNIIFKGNVATGLGNDIYNEGSIEIIGTGKVELNDGIAGSGSITSAVNNLVLNGDNSDYNGMFSQTAGTTVVGKDSKFFAGDSSINGGILNWNTANDIADGAKLTVNNAILNIGNGSDDALLTIKGASSLDNANDVVVNNNGELIFAKDATVKTINGSGIFGVKDSTLTFNNTSSIADTLGFISKDAITNIVGTDDIKTSAIISAIINGENDNLKLIFDDVNVATGIDLDGTKLVSGTTKNNVSIKKSITGSGDIYNEGTLNVVADESQFTGKFEQTAGTTTVDKSDNLFGGEKNILAGALNIKSGDINYKNIKLASNTSLSHIIDSQILNKLDSSVIEFTGSDAIASFISPNRNGNLELERIDNGNKNTISIDGHMVTLSETDYTGNTVYNFENSDIKLGTNAELKDYEISNMTGSNNSLSFNVQIEDVAGATDGSKYLKTDTIKIANGGQSFNIGNIYLTGKENGWNGQYDTHKDVLDGATFTQNSILINALATGATTSYIYNISGTDDGHSIKMTIEGASDNNTLYRMNHLTDGTRFFQFSDDGSGISQTYNISQSLDKTLNGTFTISGYGKDKCTISGALVDTDGKFTGERGSFFDIDGSSNVKLTIKDLAISEASKDGSGSVVSNASADSVVNIIDALIGSSDSTKGNFSTGTGGAIYNEAGTLNIADSVFANNGSNTVGGAIYNNGNMTLTNTTFEEKTANALNDINQGVSGITTMFGTNTINSDISGSGEIVNNGNLILGGNNSNYVGNFIQNQAKTLTTVKEAFFTGNSTISNGGLLWLAKNGNSGILTVEDMAKLVIGNSTDEANLELVSGSSISDTAEVGINKNASLSIAGGNVELNQDDAWIGRVDITSGNLVLDSLKGNGEISATGGIVEIKKGNLYVDSASVIEETAKNIISKDASFIVAGNGKATLNGISTGQITNFDDSDIWNGKVILAENGNLTLKDLSSNGVIEAINGTLNIESGNLTVSTDSVIAGGVKTIIAENSVVDIQGGVVTIDDNDIWNGTIQLGADNKGGILNYATTNSGSLKADSGNLNLLKDSILNLKSPSQIASDVLVDIQKGATVNVNDGGIFNLDANDKWNGKITVNENGLLYTDKVDNSILGGVLQQNGGDTIFDNKSQIFIVDDSYIKGGNVSVINGSLLHFGNNVPMSANKLAMTGTSTLSIMNGSIDSNRIGDMSVSGTNNVAIDVNPRDKVGDTFIIDNLTGVGTLNVSDFNFVGDAPIDRHVKFQVFDANKISDVDFRAVDKKIFTPIGDYRLLSLGGGAYSASLVDYNPQVFRGQVATMAAYNHQLLIDDMVTNHFILPNESLIDKAALANKSATISPLFAPYQNTLEEGELWYKSYVSFETLSMNNNIKAGNNVYGSLIGADLPMVHLKNGWKMIPTAYIGYNGGNQNFNKVGSCQNGGQGGLMGTFIKNDFIGSITAYAGGYSNEMNVAGVTDKSGNWFAGSAAKLAYNFHPTKHFIIQPTAFIAYNIFGKQKWNTDFGVMSMNSGLLNGINVAPGLNLIYSRDTWNVYGTVQYMYNINDQISGKAGNVELPNLEMRHGYINYGVGVTKTYKDRLNSYVQINLRNGGRTGIGFQLGFNLYFDWNDLFRKRKK